jgi:membrane-bound lytic murein transglycosylase D
MYSMAINHHFFRFTSFLVLFGFCSVQAVLGQVSSAVDSVRLTSNTLVPLDAFSEEDLYIEEIDSMLMVSIRQQFCFSSDSSLLNIHRYDFDSIPAVDPFVVADRLEILNAESPMDISWNPTVQQYINYYVVKRKMQSGRMLSLSQQYFPLFEEKLDKYNLPLELKYLSVVESALNPQAKSRVGASGLWQFMYATGKAYDLRVNSFVDERMDPEKATEAACQYLKKLYGMYDDWMLALAAYNSGPGNVNKAIRRSGGKRTYWEIRPYLPRETKGYVPSFIAVAYAMNFASDHNIYPSANLLSWYECDTIQLNNKEVRFDQVVAHTSTNMEEIQWLNPMYTKGLVPADGHRYALRLPASVVTEFIQNEALIYSHEPEKTLEVTEEEEPIIYPVKSGDVLGTIAQKHGVSVSQLKQWNNIRGTLIRPGQKLRIYTDRRSSEVIFFTNPCEFKST